MLHCTIKYFQLDPTDKRTYVISWSRVGLGTGGSSPLLPVMFASPLRLRLYIGLTASDGICIHTGRDVSAAPPTGGCETLMVHD